jgi:hypothetical protein
LRLTLDLGRLALWLWLWRPVRRDADVERAVAVMMVAWHIRRAGATAYAFGAALHRASLAVRRFTIAVPVTDELVEDHRYDALVVEWAIPERL